MCLLLYAYVCAYASYTSHPNADEIFSKDVSVRVKVELGVAGRE